MKPVDKFTPFLYAAIQIFHHIRWNGNTYQRSDKDNPLTLKIKVLWRSKFQKVKILTTKRKTMKNNDEEKSKHGNSNFEIACFWWRWYMIKGDSVKKKPQRARNRPISVRIQKETKQTASRGINVNVYSVYKITVNSVDIRKSILKGVL